MRRRTVSVSFGWRIGVGWICFGGNFNAARGSYVVLEAVDGFDFRFQIDGSRFGIELRGFRLDVPQLGEFGGVSGGLLDARRSF